MKRILLLLIMICCIGCSTPIDPCQFECDDSRYNDMYDPDECKKCLDADAEYWKQYQDACGNGWADGC